MNGDYGDFFGDGGNSITVSLHWAMCSEINVCVIAGVTERLLTTNYNKSFSPIVLGEADRIGGLPPSSQCLPHSRVAQR